VDVFVCTPPNVSIPQVVRVFKCVSVKVLFVEFVEIKSLLWGGYLWWEGYAVRTAIDVTGAKVEEYISRK
jgi:REP element-mobilizing transposase RayT